MEKASEAMYGNFYEAPWQPVREGIGRVVFAGAHAKGCTLALAECQNGNAVRPLSLIHILIFAKTAEHGWQRGV